LGAEGAERNPWLQNRVIPSQAEEDEIVQRTKVFAIGFHRTGTTSIARALDILGYRCTGPNFTFEENLPETIHGLAVNLARQYDAFSDSPWFLLYKELDEQFPGSKFILTLRPTDKWLKSARESTIRTPMQRLIYGKYIATASNAHLRDRYERHNREVQDYFRDRPGDLLVIDFSVDAEWLPLCRFLGEETPDVPFPHLNRSPRQRSPGRVVQKLLKKKRSHYMLATQRIPSPIPHADGNSGRNILLLSISAGAGCVRAADATAAALRRLAPASHVNHVDLLQLPGAVSLRNGIDESYRRIEREPGLWDGAFDDDPKGAHAPGGVSSLRHRLRRKWASYRREVRLRHILPALTEPLSDRPWDAVFSTSTIVSNLMSAMKVSGALSAPLFVINTDFMTRRADYVARCDHYFASCDDSADYLATLGWLPHKITVTGIPIMPEFARPPDRKSCREHFGLRDDKPVVVLLSGGFGMESTAGTLQHLVKTEAPLQILVCAGRNQELRRQLEHAPHPARHDVQVLGWTDEVAELLAAADLVLSKPGGLISAETLAVGAAMAIINPLGPHERQNERYLTNGGAAVSIEDVRLIPQQLEGLLAQPQQLAQLRAAARRMARPEAAFDIARFALEWLAAESVFDSGRR
jgi:processive 1,2-diacylglycerol beta-glucosyltransferase